MLQNLTGSRASEQFKREILAKLSSLGLSCQDSPPAIKHLWSFLDASSTAKAGGKRKAAAKLMHLLAAEIGVPKAKSFVAWLAEYRKPEEPITIDDTESLDVAKTQSVRRDRPPSSLAQVTGMELFDPEAPVRLEAQPTNGKVENSCNESLARPLASPPWRVAVVPPPPPPSSKEFTVPPPPPCEEINPPDLKVAQQQSLAFNAASAETQECMDGSNPAHQETGSQSGNEGNLAALLDSLQALACTVETSSLANLAEDPVQQPDCEVCSPEEKQQSEQSCSQVFVKVSDMLPLRRNPIPKDTPLRCASREAEERNTVSERSDLDACNHTSKPVVVEPGIMHLSRAEVHEHSSDAPKESRLGSAPPMQLHHRPDLVESQAVTPPTQLRQEPDLDGSQAVAPTALSLHQAPDLGGSQAVTPSTQFNDQQSLAVKQLNQKIEEASAESAQLRAELAAFKKHLAELVCTEVSTITRPSVPSRSRSRHNSRSPSSGSDRSCHPRQDPDTLSDEGRRASPTRSARHAELVKPMKTRMHRNRSYTRGRSPSKPASPVKMSTHPKRSCPRNCSPREDPKTTTLNRHSKPTHPASGAKSASSTKIQANRNRSCSRSRSPCQLEFSQWSELGWAGPGSARRGDSPSCSLASSFSSECSESPKRSRPRVVARRTTHPLRSRSQSSQEPSQRLHLQGAASCGATLKPREALATTARSKVHPAISPTQSQACTRKLRPGAGHSRCPIQASTSRSPSAGCRRRSRSSECNIGSVARSCSPQRWRCNSRSPSFAGEDHKPSSQDVLHATSPRDQEQSGRDVLLATTPLDSAARKRVHKSDCIDEMQSSGVRRRLSLGGA